MAEDKFLMQVTAHRVADHHSLFRLQRVEHCKQIVDGLLKCESWGAGLAVTAHIPGHDAKVLTHQRQGRVPLAMVNRRAVSEDNQGCIVSAAHPVMEFESIAGQKSFRTFHRFSFRFDYWFTTVVLRGGLEGAPPFPSLPHPAQSVWSTTMPIFNPMLSLSGRPSPHPVSPGSPLPHLAD